jgi:ribosome-binding ATPase YchF (GTP1/OBG family)
MRISAFSLPDITLGKHNVKDNRLDELEKIVKSKKKTYVQVEIAGEEGLQDADVILTLKDSLADLILKDLEFIETRLAHATEDSERVLLSKLKETLEKENFIFNSALSEEEKKAISAYGLLTNKPISVLETKELADFDNLLVGIIKQSGFISFFTTTGEKEARAWLVKKGSNAWEAAGLIHSDIQRGFIRAEIIGFDDFIQSGGEAQAKQAGKMHLEQKEYVMQDGDIVNFRFNK